MSNLSQESVDLFYNGKVRAVGNQLHLYLHSSSPYSHPSHSSRTSLGSIQTLPNSDPPAASTTTAAAAANKPNFHLLRAGPRWPRSQTASQSPGTPTSTSQAHTPGGQLSPSTFSGRNPRRSNPRDRTRSTHAVASPRKPRPTRQLILELWNDSKGKPGASAGRTGGPRGAALS